LGLGWFVLQSDGFSARERISSSSICETIYYTFEQSSPSKFKGKGNIADFNEFWADIGFHRQADFYWFTIWKSGFRHITDTLRIITTWNGLICRSTAMLEDVHTIFATIMGRSPAELLKIPSLERMKAILRVQNLPPCHCYSLTCRNC
jgi:hypothetical protein